jgi:hypothetical protein
LPGAVGFSGGWLMPLCLPRQAQPSERVLVSVQGGAAMGAVVYVASVAFPLTLATLTVDAMPSGHHTELLHQWLDSGEWITLSLRNMTWLLVLVIGAAITWASEATIAVGLMMVWQKIRKRASENANDQVIPPSIPEKTSPPTPGV